MELKTVIEMVTDRYNKDKSIEPHVIIESTADKKKGGVIPLDLSTIEVKEKYKKLCSGLIHKIKPDKYYLITEAVYSLSDKDHVEIKKGPYCENTKTENDCIVILEYCKNMKVKVAHINIKNEKLQKPEIFKKLDSSDEWNFYLEK